MHRHAAALLLVLIAGQAAGAVFGVTISPQPPLSDRPVTARIEYGTVCFEGHATTVVSGAIIRTTIAEEGCFPGPPPLTHTIETTFGPLPAGTYMFEIYQQSDVQPRILIHSQQLVIVGAQVPALDEYGLAGLAALLAIAAVVAIRRLG
jgi:hypothetical protein